MSQTETLQSHADLAVATKDGVEHRPIEADADGTIRFVADGAPGLYQLSVILDASDYDWDLLYEPLEKYHNEGQVTGPWDFSINHGSVPVVPAYWVTRNGRRLGLWYMQRISLDDLERKRFRGRMAFLLEDEPAEFELEPYREMNVRWQSAVLEPDPVDRLDPLPADIRPGREVAPATEWADPDFWAHLRNGLDDTHAIYRDAHDCATAWVLEKDPGLRALAVYMAAWKLQGREEALEAALAHVDALVERECFGNEAPDAYGHNGDMGAMYMLMPLTWAYHALADEMGEGRRERVREKIRLQGELFFEQALLMRDYWGGSVLQDHGWRSMFGFGSAALHMLGEIPEAERWVAYIIPRLRRSLGAMARDGAIPPSSHYRLFLYVDEVTYYRDALLAATGEDIFDQPQFRRIVDFLLAVYDRDTGKTVFGRHDAEPLYGGNQFLNRIASKFEDTRAAWLQRQIVRNCQPDFCHSNQPYAYNLGNIHGLLSYDPNVPARDPGHPDPALRHFDDSGVVHYRNDKTGVVLSAQVGPICGRTGYRNAPGPCDRLAGAPGAGHFTLTVQGVPLLCSPEGGYRLKTFLRNTLLIDDEGQFGDIGYPMSIPSWKDRGERVEFARFDAASGQGRVRLDLAPAYAEETGVLHYSREFLVGPEREIVVRDHVVCDRPRTLSWLFHTKERFGLQVDGLQARMGDEPSLSIAPRGTKPALTASARPTRVVWSYSSPNDFRPFVHARYNTTAPIEGAVVEFAIAW